MSTNIVSLFKHFGRQVFQTALGKAPKRYAALFVGMKIKQILILLTVSLSSFGQNKFIGEFKRLYELADTVVEKPMENMYNKNFIIRSDFTYNYTEEENPNAFDKPQKESIEGSWKSNGDTITFFNKNYEQPKGYKYNYYPNQKFDGIKLIIKNADLKRVDFAWCSLDSFGVTTNTNYQSEPYRNKLKNEVIIVDTFYTTIHFAPKGFCKEFRECSFSLGLGGIKSGTLIELIVYSREMEITFDSKLYILTKNILHEVSTKCYMPDAWTDNFIRTK